MMPFEPSAAAGFLSGPGEMRARMRTHDWSASPLGRPETWPQPLKTIAGIMLAANQAMFAAWGPSQAMIYNDAYATILGNKHPAALGRPFSDVWFELSDSVGPIMARAYAGEPTTMSDIELTLMRSGHPEQAHFSFFYAPVLDEAGQVGGMFCACHETTQQVVSLRAQQEADARSRQILDSAVMATGLDGIITRWNEGARRIFLWTEAEMLGRSISRIFTPEDRANNRLWTEMREAAETGEGDDERWHIRKTGERFWADGEMSPLRGEAGQITGFVKVLRDRTEQRLADSRLLASEARFRTLAEATPGFAWTTDAAGMLDYVSPRWHDITGVTGQADCAAWIRAVHSDDRERILDVWQRCVASGALFETELRLRAADGSYQWWLARAFPARDDAGAITMWAGLCTDIETIVQSREALARSREELEALVAARTADRDRMWRLSSDIMVVARLDRTITAVNPAWTALLGWTEADLIGRKLFDFIHQDDLSRTEAVSSQLSAGNPIVHFVNRYRHRDGSQRWLSWTAVPDANFIHAVGRDVTAEREQAEALAKTEEALRQSQKMEAVGQLTGGIAHDFNNLLTGITGSLELMQTRLAQQRYAGIDRYVSIAQVAAGRAAALTHRLLAFSRQQRLDPKPTDTNALIAGMLDLIRRTVGPAIEVTAALSHSLWDTLCDPNQLENAILNLCINARDAMPDGGVLSLETENTTYGANEARTREIAPGEYVELTVSDTGTGMTPDVAARAFDPFFTTKPMGQGTGLGLSMIYGFARQSGGSVRLTSALGAGTVIRMTLPRHTGQPAEVPPLHASAPPSRAEAGETILVVDDEQAVRQLIIEVLRDLGYATLEAEDGASGLAILQSGARIDLLVSDVGMPGGMNGRQMADAGRLARPELKVLFITGYVENAVLGTGDLGPATHVLTKPFAMDMLAGRVQAIIRG
jgi:PAS domain S-box-containing protein